MYGDFILWFRYKMKNRFKMGDFIEDLKWEWIIFKRQNIKCVHDYKLLKAELSMRSLYGCKHCGRKKLTKRNIY